MPTAIFDTTYKKRARHRGALQLASAALSGSVAPWECARATTQRALVERDRRERAEASCLPDFRYCP
jgi:hypothetical protein